MWGCSVEELRARSTRHSAVVRCHSAVATNWRSVATSAGRFASTVDGEVSTALADSMIKYAYHNVVVLSLSISFLAFPSISYEPVCKNCRRLLSVDKYV